MKNVTLTFSKLAPDIRKAGVKSVFVINPIDIFYVNLFKQQGMTTLCSAYDKKFIEKYDGSIRILPLLPADIITKLKATDFDAVLIKKEDVTPKVWNWCSGVNICYIVMSIMKNDTVVYDRMCSKIDVHAVEEGTIFIYWK